MTGIKPVAIDRTALAGLDRLSRQLGFLGARQSVLAGNLANIDTPGFRARDVTLTEKVEVDVSTSGAGRTLAYELENKQHDDEVPDADGNTVALETQIAKLDETNLRYRSLAELLSRRIGMLRYAANDGRG